MKVTLVVTALLCAISIKAGEVSSSVLIAEVRKIAVTPDQWSDMSDELQKLDSIERQSSEDEKVSLQVFRQKLLEYRGYFSDQTFTLSSEEKTAIAEIVLAYEQVFKNERARLLKLWDEHPELLIDSPPTGLPQWRQGDEELLKCWAIFSKHASTRKEAIKLAGSYMEVMRGYGHILNDLIIKPIEPN